MARDRLTHTADTTIGHTDNPLTSPVVKRPRPPAHLSTAAKREFNRLVKSLPVDHFGAGDIKTLGLFVGDYVDIIEMETQIRKEGRTFTDLKGITRPNPLVAICDRAKGRVYGFAPSLRLTPRSRSGTTLSKESKKAQAHDAIERTGARRPGLMYGVPGGKK